MPLGGWVTENCLGQGLLQCFASVKSLNVTDQLSRQQNLKFGIAFSQPNALKTGILGPIHVSFPNGVLGFFLVWYNGLKGNLPYLNNL